MWQEKQAEFFRQEIASLLAPLAGSPNLLEVVQDSLRYVQKEASLGSKGERPWSLLPVIVCESVCGQDERAIPASAAISLARAALEVFDDIEDADNPDSIAAKYGGAVATNVATALLFTAESALTRLKTRGVPDTDIVRVVDTLNAYHLIACIGQHSDILFSGDTSISEAQYLKLIEMKGASQVECSCHVGAILGNGSQELVETFSKLGRCLGIAAQIANDIRGVTHGSDIEKQKVTLPVIFALTQANGEIHEQIARVFQKPLDTSISPENVRDVLFKTGAMEYAAIKMEIYRQEAREALSEAKAGGAHVERLEPFLE